MLLDRLLPSARNILQSDASSIQNIEIKGLSADSRTTEKDHLFIALKGNQVDGARFIHDALAMGAVAILTDEVVGDLPVPVIKVDNARLALAQMAALFYEKQPAIIGAVTGTAGKTSVASFLRQIWEKAGHVSASVGTVGVISDVEKCYGSLTTPDPVTLHQTLNRLNGLGVNYLALEASSHGLHQYRLDGVKLSVAAFTNLGRDHMDYHETVEDYFDAKIQLFERLLGKGKPAIFDLDAPYGNQAFKRAEKAGASVLSVGEKGQAIRLLSFEKKGNGQLLKLDFSGEKREILLPLVGRFQISNALIAAGMAFGVDDGVDDICGGLENLQGEKGRLEFIGQNKKGALVFIDYAHKVEALQNVIQALRPYCEKRLMVLFGAGGDRDKGKRPLMGAVAKKYADYTVITDDNPRHEEAFQIRQEILSEIPEAIEIGDREEAIFHILAKASEGDVVIIAGKGHETGQIVGDAVLPFSDHDVVKRAIELL